SAAVVMERLELGRRQVVFHSASGPLSVTRSEAGYVMDFPARPSTRLSTPPAGMVAALGIAPLEVHANEFNYLALLPDPNTVRALAPDFAAVARLDRPCVIVTAAGEGGFDFTSRY